jgi:hypothetical protein
MAWRVLYPTTPLTDLPPAVKKEVTQILTSTLPEHPPAAAPPPRPANNGQRTPQLPPHVVERLKELQRSYPHPQRPVALPPPAILPTVIGTDSTTGEDHANCPRHLYRRGQWNGENQYRQNPGSLGNTKWTRTVYSRASWRFDL